VTENTFHGSLCCQWQLSKGERKTNCVVLFRITGVFLVERRKHTHSTHHSVSWFSKDGTNMLLPKHFLCYLAHIWQASRSFIAYINVLLIRHTTDGSEVKTPFLVYSISFKLVALTSQSGDSGSILEISRDIRDICNGIPVGLLEVPSVFPCQWYSTIAPSGTRAFTIR